MSGEKTTILREQFLDPSVGMVGTTKNYDKMADQYNKIVTGYQYKGPVRAAKTLANLVGDRTRSDMKIMDLGCGTGLVGEALHAAGFTNIDGLDPSQGMLDVARSKGVYKELFCAYVALNDEKLPIPDNDDDDDDKDDYNDDVGVGMVVVVLLVLLLLSY
ncbi:Williams-Beuren syndrome chromosomal region 27 protein-like [Elysia marginata]|uniref:Williams-Beuren syndrome chromosomal region 27 protein-like n=1 Tax=Elysia marginata TaxID=1093978 RepID=A0AAV4GE29_9GAST|nr:Williams-Beuren syndrome chromosomal region 27 protein-like [Elysia marginata]